MNGAGVVCVRQGARWEASDVEWLLERGPDRRGRSHRDDWLEEARAAHIAKYGEEPD